jgi:tetratricopeptide (TPR) repeat protein
MHEARRAGKIGLIEKLNMNEHPTTGDLERLQREANQARAAYDYEIAIGRYTAALAQLPQSRDPALEYQLRSGRAACCHMLGDYRAEMVDLQLMAELAEDLGDLPPQVAASTRQTTLLALQGNAAMGQRLAEDALEKSRQAGEPRLEAECLVALGEACFRLSEYERAQECCRQQLAIFQDIGDRAGEASALNGLSIAADYAQRRAYLEQALAIFQEIGDHERRAALANNLALIYLGLGL